MNDHIIDATDFEQDEYPDEQSEIIALLEKRVELLEQNCKLHLSILRGVKRTPKKPISSTNSFWR